MSNLLEQLAPSIQFDWSACSPPGQTVFENSMHDGKVKEPGVDGVPYAAWGPTLPLGAEILGEATE
eukprot:1527179-Karenia_brevis.AAC.1